MKYEILNRISYLFRKKGTNFFSTKRYWEKRYENNGNSGAGSYGELANFKAEILNDFVRKNNINTVIELGCGDGNQLELANYKNYIGFDITDEAIRLCRKRFQGDKSKSFYNYKSLNRKKNKADLVLSLDVVFHLIEDEVFDLYMKNLFLISKQYVIIYSCNHDEIIADHVKCRKFTDWIKKNQKGKFQQVNCIKNKFPFEKEKPNETSFSDFYFYEKVK